MRESIIFNPCDGVRNCDPHQGFTIKESKVMDDSNGRMKDDFRGIWRGTIMKETIIRVDGGCEVWNDLHWQVSPQFEIIIPTFIFINPRDCEDPSLDRASEFIPNPVVVNDPWVE